VHIQYSQVVKMFLRHGVPNIGLHSFTVLQHSDSAVKIGVVSTISTSLCLSERIALFH
jgi:hypothetical protein